MNCEQANQIDLVDYLHSLGHEPSKIRGNDYWYLSPLRNEKEPSFKVNRNKNVWYDYGLGKGGKLVGFVTEFYQSHVSEALHKISFFHEQNSLQNMLARPPFHPHQNALFNEGNERETAIIMRIEESPPISN